ncbi:unnamed protein product [Adineta steineri]|uniref:Methyltransferase type 11 domain-containing protein n=1 Tax=Adineta steineri TaxID=433720 RepID=A0A819D786_9BILA|nr:unnamed protein product [Adineta steineri]CAF3828788.1 unnamed protein product [Adineta steineri]
MDIFYAIQAIFWLGIEFHVLLVEMLIRAWIEAKGDDHKTKLFDYIIDYYFNDKNTRKKIPLALDIGCGNGQAAVDLSSFCERVIGIDVNADQIANAMPKHNVEYRCCPGEDLSFLQSNSIDLITIAKTLHWLDLDKCFKEIKRVLKPHTGVLAIWTHTFDSLDSPVADAIYYEFHHGFLSSHWHPKQHLSCDYYKSLIPRFPYNSTLNQYTIECSNETTLRHVLGLIETEPACQAYREQVGEQAYQDKLKTLRHNLSQCYIKTEVKNGNDDTINLDSIQITIARPIRLYLMKKE